jgi:hypothetical protein
MLTSGRRSIDSSSTLVDKKPVPTLSNFTNGERSMDVKVFRDIKQSPIVTTFRSGDKSMES